MTEQYERIGYFNNKIIYSNNKGNFIIKYSKKKMILLNQGELGAIEQKLGNLEKNLLKGDFKVKKNPKQYYIDLRGNVVFENPYKGKDGYKEVEIRKENIKID